LIPQLEQLERTMDKDCVKLRKHGIPWGKEYLENIKDAINNLAEVRARSVALAAGRRHIVVVAVVAVSFVVCVVVVVVVVVVGVGVGPPFVVVRKQSPPFCEVGSICSLVGALIPGSDGRALSLRSRGRDASRVCAARL
jgi:hypothetical protein